LDVNEDNSVDFREFVTGMALVSSRVNQEEKLKFVWDRFDRTNAGKGENPESKTQQHFY